MTQTTQQQDATTREMSHGTVRLETAGGVARVVLTRAQSLNSMTREAMHDLIEAGRLLIDDESVRAVVLTGEGRAFCSGLDMSAMKELGGGARPTADVEQLGAAKAVGQQAVHVWSLVPVPVIAAVHGVAFGAGLQIAAGADLRIVAPDAKLSAMEIEWGIIPDMCGTQILPALMGISNAKRIIFTGEVFSGEQGFAWGYADELSDDPLARALERAELIASKSRPALVEAKHLTGLAGKVTLEEGFDEEQRALNALIGTPEQSAVVAARLQMLAERKKG